MVVVKAGSQILVTGGAGFIGSHTVVELVAAGFKPVVLDNLCNSSLESLNRVEKITGTKIPFHEANILDREALEKVFKEYSFSAVIHFAALKAVGESVQQPLEYYQNNVTGTLVLLEVMKKFNVKNLVFSSSATVYGDPEKVPIDEAQPVGKCTNPYGKTKYFIEEICRDLSISDKAWNIVLLRYFNPIGAHESGLIGEDPRSIPNNLMPFVTQVAVGIRPQLSVFGGDYPTHDGTGVRDYIHVVDLALGHVAAINKMATATEEATLGCVVYNLGSGQGVSVLDLVKALEKASGKTVKYSIVDRRPGDVAVCYADPSKALRELNWKTTKSLDQMCADSWRWQSNNPNGFRSA